MKTGLLLAGLVVLVVLAGFLLKSVRGKEPAVDYCGNPALAYDLLGQKFNLKRVEKRDGYCLLLFENQEGVLPVFFFKGFYVVGLVYNEKGELVKP